MALSLGRIEQSAQALERGRELYVAGRFFDAHEVWEEAWREEHGAMRRLLHGLIQVAAAYHKMAVQRQPLGMTKLLAAGIEQLAPLPDGMGGLQLTRFRDGLAQSRQEALVWLAGGPAPAGPAPLGIYVREAGSPSEAP